MKKDWLFSIPACSSMTLTSAAKKTYWFRTCDLENEVREEGAHVVQKARGSLLTFSNQKTLRAKYAYLGMSYNEKDEWLLDGVNETGLAGGLLMLPEATSTDQERMGYEGCVGMEVVTRLLSSCKNVEEVKNSARKLQILDIPFAGGWVPASMHYFFVDQTGNETILEAANQDYPGILQIYEREEIIGVMTNGPVYPKQVNNLSWFMAYSLELQQGMEGKPIQSLEFDGRVLQADSRKEHLSLYPVFPGGYSSHDRFLRLALFKALNACGNNFTDEEMAARGSMIMSVVVEPNSRGIFHGYCQARDGKIVGQKESYTQYLLVYNLEKRSLQLRFHDELNWREYTLDKGFFD